MKPNSFTCKFFGSIFFFLLFGVSIHAQSLQLQNYKAYQGLSSDKIYEITQDKRGYIWLGTANGLCRFDGKSFKNHDSPFLKDAEIVRVRELVDGTVGFCNLSGQMGIIKGDSVWLYLSGKEKLSGITNMQLDNVGNFYVCGIKDSLEGKRGNYWGVLSRISSDWAKEEVLLFHNSHFRNIVWHPDRKVIMVPRNKGLCVFSQDTTGFIALNPPLSAHIHRFYPSKKGVRIVDRGRMNLLDVDIDQRRTHYLKVVGIPEKVTQYYDWLVDDTGIHWLATDQGVFLCEKRGNSRLHVFQTIKLLENLDVYCLFLDKERNLWIGTAQTGLFLMPSAKTFKWDLKEQGLANQYVKLLTAYNSEKVVGITNEGYLLEVSKDSFEAKKVLPRGDYKGIYLGPNHRKFAYGNQPFYEITSGEKVISYFNDDVSNRFTGNNVKSLIWWNDKIYSGDPNGFVILDKTREKTRLLLEGRTMKVFKDRFKDEIWLGNINGLHVFSETDSVRLYQDKSGNKVPFLIYSMAQSNDSSLFLGSHGKGLWVLKNGVLTRIDSILGIESKIYSELMVSGSDLWATTENGLYKANLTEMKSQKLNLNGLSSYSTVFGLTETKDMIWVSTLEGITFFPKEQSKDKIRPPNVYLDKFIARNISGETSNSYDLPYAFRHVRIQFSAVYFQGQLEYKVKSGEEQYWSSLKEPRLELSSLAPGNYTYFIKAITPNGTESEEPLEISFTINPPIWLTLEFWILLLLGMGVIMFLGIRYYINKRVQRVKDIAKMQRQIDQFRLQALRAQMNPHFTFNALNGIQSLLLKEQTDSALRYLADFSQLIRKSLDKSDDDWINLKDEIAFLKNYIKLEELRFGDKVKVYWVGEQTFGIDRLVIPNMILQPIVENAFKHGLSHLHANGQLLIGIDVQKEIITIVVEDNGIGRKRSAEYSRELHPNHQSKGLSMVQDRLDWLYRDQRQKARIYILDLPQNGPDSLQKSTFLQGTLVSLKLPLIYEKIE